MRTRIFFVIAAMLVFGLGIATFAYKQTTSSGIACCKGDSCPMKKKDEASPKAHAADHKDCECCKDGADSCPMRKKDGEAKVSAASASDEGKSCCDNCTCCKGKAKDTAV